MTDKICFRLRKALNVLLSIVVLLAIAAGPAAQARGAESAAVDMGASGLSFRYDRTFGVTGEPYLADGQHLNTPTSMFMSASNTLYVVEEKGSRVLRFSPTGTNTLILGQAGIEFHHDNFLADVRSVAVAPGGNIWALTTTMLKEFNSRGEPLRRFPDEDPWNSGEDNSHFKDAYGIAFHNSGLLFVADLGNNRVQIYDTTTETPTYVNTIGETGVAVFDNLHFNQPSQLAFDSHDALYVLDSAFFRVQKCTSSNNWASWSCGTFFGGTQGSDPANGEMSWSYGLHIDGSDNVFIADGGNSRVLKCTPVGVCDHFVGTLGVRGTGNNIFGWAADVTADSDGNVYVSDTDNRVVKQYSSTGAFIKNFVGVLGVPYLTNTAHMNKPWGITTDSAGNIYVTENGGHRLLKFNASGIQQWAIGSPGNFIFDWNDVTADNQKFSDYWAGLEGNPAVDSAGNIYVTDTSNQRVQVYKTSDGSYVTSLGVFRESGADSTHFDCPTGAAVSPVNGDIFIANHCNHTVSVFNSSRVYKTAIGVPYEKGADNIHLSSPWGVAVDRSGAVYIADADNMRIQKCTLAGATPTCSTFAGETGVFDQSLNHFYPVSVAVDGSGKVYVADDWNSRIQVFDSTGAYLTTIAGSWGTGSSQFVNTVGVAVDARGSVYITDRSNYRVEKYTPGYPRWIQANINGFGSLNNVRISRMSVHNGMLYASLENPASGGEVWRSADGRDWGSTPVAEGGFGNSANNGVDVAQSYGGYLYAGTNNTDTGGEMWRCAVCDGSDWEQVVDGTLLGQDHYHVQTVITHGGALYATVEGYNEEGAHAVAVIRSTTGARGTWTQVNTDGFGNIDNRDSWSAADFNGYYYVATSKPDAWNTGPAVTTGVEVWRCATCDGSDWVQVNEDGFGDGKNCGYWFAVYNNGLYLGIANLLTGAQIWRCSACDGTDWAQVASDGFGNASRYGVFPIVFDGKLYAYTSEFWETRGRGVELFASEDGLAWTEIPLSGWGDLNNQNGAYGIVYNDSLYLSTSNPANGGEIWLYLLRQVHLPLIRR